LVAIGASGLVVVLLGVGAYGLGAMTAPHALPAPPAAEAPAAAPPEPAPPSTAPPPTAVSGDADPPRLRRGEASGQPTESAVSWLRAYRSVRFDDSSPSSWINRVRPVVTAGLYAEYESYRGGSTGAEWDEFVRGRCQTVVEDVGAVIPDEAPRTEERVSVQVAGTAVTRCDTGAAAAAPPEPVAATLELVKARDGLWRVSRRLY
jgi:hypothetical protein